MRGSIGVDVPGTAAKDGPPKHSALKWTNAVRLTLIFVLLWCKTLHISWKFWNEIIFGGNKISRVSDLPRRLISEAIWNIWNAVVSFSHPAKMTPGRSTITLCVFAVNTNGCRWSILHLQIRRFTPNLSQHAAQLKREGKLSIGSACCLSFRY